MAFFKKLLYLGILYVIFELSVKLLYPFADDWYRNQIFFPVRYHLWILLAYITLATALSTLLYRLAKPLLLTPVPKKNSQALLVIGILFLIHLFSVIVCWLPQRDLPVNIRTLLYPIYMTGTGMIQTGIIRILCFNFLIILLAPFLEELFYRGILSSYLNGFSLPFQITVTTLLFAIGHLGRVEYFADFVYYTIMGLLFFVAYLYRKNLWDSILLHALVNGLLGLLVFEFPRWVFK